MGFLSHQMIEMIRASDGSNRKPTRKPSSQISAQGKGLRVVPVFVEENCQQAYKRRASALDLGKPAVPEAQNLSRFKFLQKLITNQVNIIKNSTPAPTPIDEPGSFFKHYKVDPEVVVESPNQKYMYATHVEFPKMVMLVKEYTQPQKNIPNRYYFNILRHLGRKHATIVSIFDIFKRKDAILVIEEFCNERDLGTYLKQCSKEKKSIPASQVQIWAKDMIKGMDFLGDNAICHRNIKPKSLLIQSNHIKLSGFKFAMIYWDTTAEDVVYRPCVSYTTNISGNFDAPEMYGNPSKDKYDPILADIWSYGAVIYQIIDFPEYPFKNSTPEIEKDIQSSIANISASKDCKDLLSKVLTTEVLTRIPFDKLKVHQYLK